MNRKLQRLTGDDYLSAAAPNGEKADCVVRATAVAFDVPYWEAHKFCAKQGRKTGRATNTIHIFGVSNHPLASTKSRTVFGRRVSFRERPGKTVATFVKKHQKGRFIIVVARHAFALVDGKVTGQPEWKFGQRIRHYFKISDNGKTLKGAESATQEGARAGT